MQWPKQVEKKCNCVIKWQEVSSDWDQKKQAMLASGNIPDMILKGVTLTDMSTYGSLFEDLSKDMDKMPNVKKMFDTDHMAKKIVTEDNGVIHILPSVKPGIWPDTVSRQYINKKWLDKLGLKMPTNWDELYNVLVAFKNDDPNGNGKKDEIPMDFIAPGPAGFGDYNPDLLIDSLGIVTTAGSPTGYYADNGKVKNFLTDPRYKQLIEFLNKCWKAGLINKEAFTHDYSTAQSTARGNGDTAKVGFTWGWTASDKFGNQLAPQYESVPPLKATASGPEPVYDYQADAQGYNTGALAISAKAKNKEAALKVANAFYDPDISIEVLWGDLGKDTKKLGPNSYEVLAPADKTKDASTWKWTETLADYSPFWIRPTMKVKLPADLEEARAQEKSYKPAFDRIDKQKDILPPFLNFSSDDLKTLQLNNTTILNTAIKDFGTWVTKGGVDKQWDAYVQQLKKAKIDDNIAIYQKAWAQYNKK